MIAVVHGVVDDVEEALGRVGGEVNDDPGPGRDGPRHLDVEHHLAVGVLRVVRVGARLVLGTVDRHRDDLGCGQSQAAEVRVQLLTRKPLPPGEDSSMIPITWPGAVGVGGKL